MENKTFKGTFITEEQFNKKFIKSIEEVIEELMDNDPRALLLVPLIGVALNIRLNEKLFNEGERGEDKTQ